MSTTARFAAMTALVTGMSLVGLSAAEAQGAASNPLFGRPPAENRASSNPVFGNGSSGYINRQRNAGSGAGSSPAYDNYGGSTYRTPTAPAYQQPRSSYGSNSRPSYGPGSGSSYGYDGGSAYQKPKSGSGSSSCGYASSRSRPTSGESAADASIWRSQRGTERSC